MVEDKRVLIESEMHKRLKIRASRKGKAIKEELKDILLKELEGEESNE